jgi:capsule polysaccharide export protein KpsE/RkpR
VAELNERHVALTSESARQNREFVETRVREAEADLDSTLRALQAFQEENGVIELESQVQAMLSSVAEVQARVAEAEIQYRALAQQLGDDNPQVRAAREVRNAARAEVRRLTGGSEELMPVAIAEMPALSRSYAMLRQELLIQAEILEFIRPLYEQARMEERRAMDAVQVLDPAVPPFRKAAPRRSLLCISAVVGAFLIASMFVIAQAWLRNNAGHIATRINSATTPKLQSTE